MPKKAIVVHSGGMDSSLCLALAIDAFGRDQVLSMSFSYQQRHSAELKAATKICKDWQVDHIEVPITFLNDLTSNALTQSDMKIEHTQGEAPNTLVVGRNGLMARLAAIRAYGLGANYIYMGVIGVDTANSGYRDCSREYMDLMQQILRIDLDNPKFEIRTPLMEMIKAETMALGDKLGILDYLIENTISCYEGLPKRGCEKCPACLLRNEGIDAYFASK